jgi:hypothetical protein
MGGGHKRDRARRQRQQQQADWASHIDRTSDGLTSSDGEPENIRVCLPKSDDTQLVTAPQPTDVVTLLEAKVQACIAEIERLTQLNAALSCGATDAVTEFSQSMRNISAYMCKTTQRFNSVDAALKTMESAILPQIQLAIAEISVVRAELAASNQRIATLEASQQALQLAAPVPAPSRAPHTATWASTVRGTGPQQQQPQQRPRARQPSGSPTSGLAAATLQQCSFVISGSQAETAALAGRRGDDLAAAASAFLLERLSLPAGEVRILDAIPLGKVLPTDPPTKRSRFFIRVERLAQADAIVANRHKLKGSQLAVFDDLSPQERAAHRLLWSTFVEARRLGFTAQYCRSKLVVTKRNGDGAVGQRYTIWP